MVEKRYLDNSWVEISQSAYKHNLAFFRKIIGKRTELSVVIKANAYGHGWQSMARLAVKNNAESFCVHSLDEAIKLRRAGFNQNVLIMGHVPLNLLEEVVKEGFRLAIFNRETLIRLHKITINFNKLSRIHLELETGTYRQGIDQNELGWYLEKLKEMPRVMLEAVYTHFANIEDTTNHDFADYQKNQFKQLATRVQENGFPILKQHTACTAAAMLFSDTHLDMVRLGIGQYGLWPSRETKVSYREKFGKKVERALMPVLSWKTRVTQIKEVPSGQTIGYGRSYKTTRNSRIAVLPIGYSDGYSRALSNLSYVIIKGQRAPVRGRICMNLMMVDITDIPGLKLEDEVVLIGKQNKEMITVDQLAELSGAINYEIVSRINSEIPRIIVE